jgi:hypothetical protein
MDVIFQLVTMLGQVWLSPYPKVYLEKQNPTLMSGVSQFARFCFKTDQFVKNQLL